MMRVLAKDRVAHGLCPNCGKEAAPYRLCYDCRQGIRLQRCLTRGVKHGALAKSLTGHYSISKSPPRGANKEWGKWSTAWHLPASDKRGQPRMRGMRVDVEATLLEVIRLIGRPCTIEEITMAWGRLRDRRTDPLPNDLARIIKAADKRKQKAERRCSATLNLAEGGAA